MNVFVFHFPILKKLLLLQKLYYLLIICNSSIFIRRFQNLSNFLCFDSISFLFDQLLKGYLIFGNSFHISFILINFNQRSAFCRHSVNYFTIASTSFTAIASCYLFAWLFFSLSLGRSVASSAKRSRTRQLLVLAATKTLHLLVCYRCSIHFLEDCFDIVYWSVITTLRSALRSLATN